MATIIPFRPRPTTRDTLEITTTVDGIVRVDMRTTDGNRKAIAEFDEIAAAEAFASHVASVRGETDVRLRRIGQ